MALTLERMRALVRQGVGNLDDVDLPDAEVDELLNTSLWELSEKFPFKEKECLSTRDTIIGTASYALPMEMDALISVGCINDEGQYKKLARVSQDWYENHGNLDEVEKRGFPLYYVRRENVLLIWPRPDKVYTLRLLFWRTLNSLLEGSIEVPELPRNWHFIIVQSAIVKFHFLRQDYNAARQAENFVVSMIRDAVLDGVKEERDSRYARLVVLWDWPEESEAI